MRLLLCSCLAVALALGSCSDPVFQDTTFSKSDSLPFDSMELRLIVNKWKKEFEKDSASLQMMEVNESGHEYYSYQRWFFDSSNKLRYIRVEWASESLAGETFLVMKDDSIICGEIHENLDMASDSWRWLYRKMTPYSGLHYSSEFIPGIDTISYSKTQTSLLPRSLIPEKENEVQKQYDSILKTLADNRDSIMISGDNAMLKLMTSEHIDGNVFNEEVQEFQLSAVLLDNLLSPGITNKPNSDK